MEEDYYSDDDDFVIDIILLPVTQQFDMRTPARRGKRAKTRHDEFSSRQRVMTRHRAFAS